MKGHARNSVLLTHNGETMNLTRWSRRLGISDGTLRGRISRWGVDLALSQERMDRGQFLMSTIGRPGSTPFDREQPKCGRCGLRGEHECLLPIEHYATRRVDGTGDASVSRRREPSK